MIKQGWETGSHQGKQVSVSTSLKDRDGLTLTCRVNLGLCKGSQVNVIIELILWGHFQSAFDDLYLEKCCREDRPLKSQAKYEQNTQSARD